MIYYRRRNEAIALGREFNDTQPNAEDGRMLTDGTCLDKNGKLIVEIESTP